MTYSFDQAFWESHWQQAGPPARRVPTPNPYLERETGHLAPGTALDAGCGEGAEAMWLAAHGWQVTAVDISAEGLSRAAERAATAGGTQGHVQWVEADLRAWAPGRQFDLVTTHYAHPAMPQVAFYERICEWVAPGGTLLIVGHLHTPGSTGNGHEQGHHEQGHQPPEAATATASSVTAVLAAADWHVVTAAEYTRALADPAGHAVPLRDVVVRATRRD